VTNVINLNHLNHVGGLEFLLAYLPIYLPYTTLSIIGVIVGFIGNILIIGAILLSKELRTNSTCILCLNLAFADFGVAIFVNVFTVVGCLVGETFFDQNVLLCQFIGAMCLMSCACSLVTMGYLAVNRCEDHPFIFNFYFC
jgi:hypothetical protein